MLRKLYMIKDLKKFKIETITGHSGKNPTENHGIPAPPLYRTSTILSSNMKNIEIEQEDTLMVEMEHQHPIH